MITSEIVEVAPETAEAWLAKNLRNRPVKKGHVDFLARQMPAAWEFNGDPIRFDTNGNLIDGQHRLMAVIKAGVPISFVVLRGLPPESIHTIDANRAPRTAGDSLGLLGIHNAVVTAAIARLSILYLKGQMHNIRVSNGEVVSLVHVHPRIASVASEVIGTKLIAPGVLGCVMFLATADGRNDITALNFIQRVSDGVMLDTGDPRLALRQAVENANRNSKRGAALSRQWMFAAVTMAWNAYLENRSLKIIKANMMDEFVPIQGSPLPGAGVDSLVGFAPKVARATR